MPLRREAQGAPGEVLRAGKAPVPAGSGSEDDGCTCPVCHEILHHPKMAPCGHAMCAKCLRLITAPRIRRPGMAREFNVPRCPACRMAVDPAQFVRCFALEKAIRALHPTESARLAAEDPDKDADRDAQEYDLSELQAWKAAQEEQMVIAAIRVVWAGIKMCMSTSDSLLITERTPIDTMLARNVCHHPRMVGEPIALGGAAYWDDGHAREDAPDEGCEAAIQALWACAEEVTKRLEGQGLKVTLFRYLGRRHALISWPRLGSAFPAKGD